MSAPISISSAVYGGKRRAALLLVPLIAALLFGALAELRLFRLTNGLLFDLAVSSVPTGQPQAIVVRAPGRDVPLVVQRLRELGVMPLVFTGSAGSEPLTVPEPAFGINRRFALPGGEERLIGLPGDAVMPVLSVRTLQDRALTSGSMIGLIAVVGPPTAADPPRFQGSSLPHSRLLPGADFQARAVHAWKSGSTVRELAGAGRFALLLVAALALPLLFVAAPRRFRASALLLAVGLLLGTSLLFLRAGGILLPVTELLLLAWVAAVMASSAARRDRDRRLVLLADRASSFASRNSLLGDSANWPNFFGAAARLTDVESSLLLEESAEGEFIVKAAFGPLTSNGAAGLRRTADFDRADAACPDPVDVEHLSEWTRACVARLDSGSDRPVYWLYAAPSNRPEPTLAAATRLARTIARQPALASSPGRKGARNGTDARLFAALDALVSHAGELRSSLGALQTATMLFDAAGIPLQVNPSMDRLLQQAGLQATRATPVDVAAKFAGLETETVRSMLGELIRHGGELALTAQSELGGRRYAVRVTETQGDLMFEAIDVTELHRLARIQNELATEIDSKVRNDLEAIELATRLAVDQRLPADRRDRALAMIHQATERTRATLGDLARLVDAAIYVSEEEPYPVNPRSALDQAIAGLMPLADRVGAQIKVDQPTLTALVLAEPALLDRLLRSMLEIPLSDSPRGATIHVVLKEGDGASDLAVTGGFGLSADRFEAALKSDDPNLARPIRTLRHALARVEAWGGSLQVSSDAGQGYTFNLKLKKS